MTTIFIEHKGLFLMLYRIGSRVVEPSWCGIGGHFEESELNNPEKCVIRELFEETGIRESSLDNLELRYITLRLKHNEIRQNYYYFATLITDEIDLKFCTEGQLRWVEKTEILNLEMPFTAKLCLKHYIEIGHSTKEIYGGIATEQGINLETLRAF